MRDVFFLTSGSFKAIAAALEPLSGAPDAERRGRPLGSVIARVRRAFRSSRLSNTVAVVVRDSGDVVLIDCGWSREACADPDRVVGRVYARVLGIEVKRGDAIVDQLARLGIRPERVKTIVATHLHLDHIGGVIDFPDAELVCSDVELSAARARPAALGYRATDIATARLRPVYLGARPSYGFPASFDLFGDGEVVLLDAHGHTPGQVAVALRGREAGPRCYVHVGDAAYETWEWGLSPAGPSLLSRVAAWRPDLLRERYVSLRDCEADPRRPILVPSHDARVFAELPQRPSLRAQDAGGVDLAPRA